MDKRSGRLPKPFGCLHAVDDSDADEQYEAYWKNTNTNNWIHVFISLLNNNPDWNGNLPSRSGFYLSGRKIQLTVPSRGRDCSENGFYLVVNSARIYVHKMPADVDIDHMIVYIYPYGNSEALL